ncbi:hypothetical protein M9434_002699 [Picochlorum sp. BPE23]|nr:hypothetical protein M9434_002699 [Picochlorum sp. BPE23]
MVLTGYSIVTVLSVSFMTILVIYMLLMSIGTYTSVRIVHKRTDGCGHVMLDGQDDHLIILDRIFYLHVPKCGSSFATLIVQYACPGLAKNITVKEPGAIEYPPGSGKGLDRQKYCGNVLQRFDSGHYPLPKIDSTTHQEDVFFSKGRYDVITFLRKPTDRIVSGLLDGFHSCNMSSFAAKYPWLYPGVRNPANVMGHRPNYTYMFEEADEKIVVAIVKYYWNCVAGCATKMILGEWCGDVPYPLSPSKYQGTPVMSLGKVDLALERLNKFAFIGLTGRWNESVHLWQRLFGGSYSDTVYDNTRPSKFSRYYDILLNMIQKHGLTDEADEIMYRFAEARMNALLQ